MDALVASLYVMVVLAWLYILIFRPEDRRALVLLRDFLEHPLHQ